MLILNIVLSSGFGAKEEVPSRICGDYATNENTNWLPDRTKAAG